MALMGEASMTGWGILGCCRVRLKCLFECLMEVLCMLLNIQTVGRGSFVIIIFDLGVPVEGLTMEEEI